MSLCCSKITASARICTTAWYWTFQWRGILHCVTVVNEIIPNTEFRPTERDGHGIWAGDRQLSSHLQDCSACVDVCSWCCSCISAGTLCPSRKTSEGVHGYGLHLLDVFSYRGWGRQRDSEVMRSIGRQIGTVCHQLRRTSLSLRAFKWLKTYLFGRG